jgi:hypothetical protein
LDDPKCNLEIDKIAHFRCTYKVIQEVVT